MVLIKDCGLDEAWIRDVPHDTEATWRAWPGLESDSIAQLWCLLSQQNVSDKTKKWPNRHIAIHYGKITLQLPYIAGGGGSTRASWGSQKSHIAQWSNIWQHLATPVEKQFRLIITVTVVGSFQHWTHPGKTVFRWSFISTDSDADSCGCQLAHRSQCHLLVDSRV